MAIRLDEWKEKFPDVDEDDLLNWISDMTLREIDPEHYEEYLQQRSKGIYPTNEELNRAGESAEPEDEEGNEDDEAEDDDLEDLEEPEEAPKKPSSPRSQREPALEYPPEEYERINREVMDREETPREPLKEQIRSYSQPQRHRVDEPPVPFDNPDMSDLQVPEPELEEEDDLDLEPYEPPERPKAELRREEMVTKTITIGEYEQLIKPFKPILDDIKEDSSTLNKLAAGMDSRNLPPYMQIKPYIINHPLKDPTNTKVNIYTINENNPDGVEKSSVEINRAWDLTRELGNQRHYEKYMNNYDIIIEKMMEERQALVSLIYILETYCEAKQVSPFELNIPKKILMDSIEKSFQHIKELITRNVITELGQLRGDIAGQLGDVSQLVSKNMGRFDTQIQEAVTKVMWKVKTDVESTNLEDIKKSLLFLLNKRSASYNLGGGATAIMSIMLDDLERRLLETGFKLDNISEYRRYTITELTRKLGYKKATVLIRAIPPLMNRKLIKVYDNKTISL